MEKWKPVVGYEGMYEVSNHGRVRSLDRLTSFTRGGKTHMRKRKGRVLSPSLTTEYQMVNLCKGDGTKHKPHTVHRLVALSFLNNNKGYPVVNHIDGNKHNNRVDNLEWTTPVGNSQHAHKVGLVVIPSGEDNPTSKITNREADWIRENIGILTHAEMGKRLGIARSSVSMIATGRRYPKKTFRKSVDSLV